MNNEPRFLLKTTFINGDIRWVGRAPGQTYLSYVEFRQFAAPLTKEQIKNEMIHASTTYTVAKSQVIEMGIKGLVK